MQFKILLWHLLCTHGQGLISLINKSGCTDLWSSGKCCAFVCDPSISGYSPAIMLQNKCMSRMYVFPLCCDNVCGIQRDARISWETSNIWDTVLIWMYSSHVQTTCLWLRLAACQTPGVFCLLWFPRLLLHTCAAKWTQGPRLCSTKWHRLC